MDSVLGGQLSEIQRKFQLVCQPRQENKRFGNTTKLIKNIKRVIFTHQVHRSVFPCRRPPGLNTQSWLWGRWSTCSRGCAALRCHSEDRSCTWKLWPTNQRVKLLRRRVKGTYRTHSGNHGMDVFSVSVVIRQPLTEEKIQFGIVWVSSIWDKLGINENWL